MPKRSNSKLQQKWNYFRQANEVRVANLKERFFNKESLITADKTPYEVVYREGLIKVRYYAPLLSTGQKPHAVPLIFVTPLAVRSHIYDLAQDRSLIQYLTSHGFKVYLVNWGNPSRDHTAFGLEKYVTEFLDHIVSAVQKHSGSAQYSLHGWSLGGIFALLYAAWKKDPNLKNLIVLGSPIDSYAANARSIHYERLNQGIQKIQNKTGFTLNQLPAALFHSHGWQNALGFKLLDPIGTLQGHFNMLRQADDMKVIEGHATMNYFLNNMVDYPGQIIKDMILHVWLHNTLMKGEYPLGNQMVYLKDIHANLLAVAGKDDGMVSPASVRPLTRLVSSQDTEFRVIPGGHVGMISNQQVAQQFWPVMAAWLAARSD